MAKVFLYMNRVNGWEQVAAGVTANEAQVPELLGGLSRLQPSQGKLGPCYLLGQAYGCSILSLEGGMVRRARDHNGSPIRAYPGSMLRQRHEGG